MVDNTTAMVCIKMVKIILSLKLNSKFMVSFSFED